MFAVTKRRAFWDVVSVVTIPSAVIWGAVGIWLPWSNPEGIRFAARVAGLGFLGTITLMSPIGGLIYRNNIRARRETAPVVSLAIWLGLNMLGLVVAFEHGQQHRT